MNFADSLFAIMDALAALWPDMPGIAPSEKWWLVVQICAYALGVAGGLGLLALVVENWWRTR